MMLKMFGKNPSGEILDRVKKSPNYRDGAFQNLSKTSVMSEDSSFIKAAMSFLNKPKGMAPERPVPGVRTDLTKLDYEAPTIVWFGHSSYLIHIAGKNVLVDPVFSGNASPFSFAVRSFPGSNRYDADNMPDIDVLILTHDHYDHLDYETLKELKPKVKMICTSLGVSSHLTYWGFEKERIIEFDWWDGKEILPGIELIGTPARHFSGRLFKRAQTLWSSFVLRTKDYSIFIGGDSGYDTHFKSIGDKYGPFDIALLEAGQYNVTWPEIHMMPEQTVQASIDLKVKVLMPVHWGKFSLALHTWDEPVKRVVKRASELGVQVTTPMMGEVVEVGVRYPNEE